VFAFIGIDWFFYSPPFLDAQTMPTPAGLFITHLLIIRCDSIARFLSEEKFWGCCILHVLRKSFPVPCMEISKTRLARPAGFPP
jgi:hypothetical protein